MTGGFDVHRQPGGPRIPKRLDAALRVFDHQVDVKGELGITAAVLDRARPDGDRGNEVPVHDVEVHPVGTCLFQRRHFLAQPAEIGREQRRRNQH